MFEKLKRMIRGSKNKKKERENDGITLKVMMNEKIVARLWTRDKGKIFVLEYTEDFKGSGALPFNMEHSKDPEIGKRYESHVLWYAFSSRVPSPSRPDYKPALEKAGLTGRESVLEIIGKVSKRSISRPWTIGIDESTSDK